MLKSRRILENMQAVAQNATDYCRQKVNKRVVFKTLLALCALGACIKAYPECKRALRQAMQQIEQEKAVLATLIKKELHGNGGLRYADLYLDTDGNNLTAEAVAKSNSLNQKKMIQIYNLTNGTTRTVREWEDLTGWGTVQFNR